MHRLLQNKVGTTMLKRQTLFAKQQKLNREPPILRKGNTSDLNLLQYIYIVDKVFGFHHPKQSLDFFQVYSFKRINYFCFWLFKVLGSLKKQ